MYTLWKNGADQATGAKDSVTSSFQPGCVYYATVRIHADPGYYLAAYVHQVVGTAVLAQHAGYHVAGLPLGYGAAVDLHPRVGFDDAVVRQPYFIKTNEWPKRINLPSL